MSEPAFTRMLASVADLAEMEIARAGGADIVDLKQPAFGALGAWSTEALDAAMMLWRAWPEPRPGLSATIGDQPMVGAIMLAAAQRVAATGVPIVKIGFARSDNALPCIEALAPLAARVRLVAVLFADQDPDFQLIAPLGSAGFAGVMLDTAAKKAGGLLSHIDRLTLGQFVAEARQHGLMSGLAGSLAIEDIPALRAIGPDYLGFRGALCKGGRTGRLVADRVRAVRALIPAPAGTPHG